MACPLVPVGPISKRGASFSPGDHATTFGGQPMATSAARRTLELMLEMDAPAVAAKKSDFLVETVMNIDGVVGTRGLGLLMAVELDQGIDAKAVASTCLKNGLVLNGVTATALRLTPPINISDELIAEGAGILAAAILEVRS